MDSAIGSRRRHAASVGGDQCGPVAALDSGQSYDLRSATRCNMNAESTKACPRCPDGTMRLEDERNPDQTAGTGAPSAEWIGSTRRYRCDRCEDVDPSEQRDELDLEH